MAVIKSGCNQADVLHFNQLAWIGERNSKHFLGVRTNHVSSNYIHDVHSSITLSKACVLSQPGFNYGSGWMYIMQMLNTFMHHASALQQSQTTTKMKLMAKANTLDQGHQIQIQDRIHPSLDCQQLHDNGHSSFVNQSEGLNFCQDVDVKNQSNHIKKKRLKKKNKSVIEMRVTQVIEQPQVLNANAGRCVASDYNQNQVGPVFEAKGKNPITLVDHHVQTDADGKFGHDLPTSGRSDQKTMALCLSEACAKNRALEKQLASMEGQLKQVKSIKSQSYQQYHQLYSYKSELAACQGKLAALNRRYDLILRQQQYDRSQRMIDQSRLCIALEGLKEADADLCMALDGHSVLQTTGSCSVTDQINHCVLDGDVVDVKHHSRPPLSGENP
ncbi:MAG: hypothetical protein VX313_03755, partial [Bacteroidota bacterium]|nr:hypothetical protein [Bacteroidota bacterium]